MNPTDFLARWHEAGSAERAEEEKRGIVRWLRPEFQNPQGKKDAVQDEIPGTGQKKATRGAKAAAPEKTGKRVWPKELSQQVAAVRDLLAEAGALDLAAPRPPSRGPRTTASPPPSTASPPWASPSPPAPARPEAGRRCASRPCVRQSSAEPGP